MPAAVALLGAQSDHEKGIAGAEAADDGPRDLRASGDARSMRHGNFHDPSAPGCRLGHHLHGPSERAIAHVELAQQVDPDGAERWDIRHVGAVTPRDEARDQLRAEHRMRRVTARASPSPEDEIGASICDGLSYLRL